MTVSSAPTISVRVLLFASYAEALGRASLTLTIPTPANVGILLRALRKERGGHLLPERPLCAVNLVQARPDSPIQPGDEVAILPPLSGG